MLRKLETSLHYLQRAADAWVGKPGARTLQSLGLRVVPIGPVSERQQFAELVGRLQDRASLGLEPAVASCFGTEAERINALRALPAQLLQA